MILVEILQSLVDFEILIFDLVPLEWMTGRALRLV